MGGGGDDNWNWSSSSSTLLFLLLSNDIGLLDDDSSQNVLCGVGGFNANPVVVVVVILLKANVTDEIVSSRLDRRTIVLRFPDFVYFAVSFCGKLLSGMVWFRL